jgi:hypothetical protein
LAALLIGAALLMLLAVGLTTGLALVLVAGCLAAGLEAAGLAAAFFTATGLPPALAGDLVVWGAALALLLLEVLAVGMVLFQIKK